jgi:hypothetical protein
MTIIIISYICTSSSYICNIFLLLDDESMIMVLLVALIKTDNCSGEHYAGAECHAKQQSKLHGCMCPPRRQQLQLQRRIARRRQG